MYVFGNGESRASVNIDKLEGTKVGCNAICPRLQYGPFDMCRS